MPHRCTAISTMDWVSLLDSPKNTKKLNNHSLNQSEYYCTQIEFGTPECDQALRLRDLVLRQPLGMVFDPDDIAKEFDSYHFACFEVKTHQMVATLILKPITSDVVKMRQVAVDPSLQSTGIGTMLVNESEIFAKNNGFKKIELNARDTAVPFYLKSGYKREGDVFKEVGIDHYFMYKLL